MSKRESWRKPHNIPNEEKTDSASTNITQLDTNNAMTIKDDKNLIPNSRGLSTALGLKSTAADDDEYYQEDSQIDYTNAFLKEHKHAQEILSKLRPDGLTDFDKIQLGFSKLDYDDGKMDCLAKKQFVFDLLPSFEMLQSMQNPCLGNYIDNPDEHDFPPDYFSQNIQKIYGVTGIDDFEKLTSGSSSDRPPIMLSPTVTRSQTTIYSNGITSQDLSATPSSNASSDNAENFEKNLFDKSHLLPNIDSSTLDISVHVTKDVPRPNQPTEQESLLKEYTPGDVVHGYVIINNLSTRPQKFQMFHVTLEGYTLVIDPQTKKLNQKRFLDMVDISASWTFGAVSPSANFNYEPYSLDHEGCLLGLPNDRIIPPKTKYKKFFAFKIPYRLLDNVCQHELEVHTLLPPSFGIDRVKNKGQNADIDVDPMLNYGHSGLKGSPVLTLDLSGNNRAISYGIHARFISVHPNKPKKLCILKQHEHNLRFIPFGFTTPLFSSKASLKELYERVQNAMEISNHVLEMKLKNSEFSQDDDDDFIRDLKSRQLRSVSSDATTYESRDTKGNLTFPLRNKSFGNRDFSKVEIITKYMEDSSSNTSGFLKNLRFGAQRSQTNNSIGQELGSIKITTRIPKDGLPYISPSLVRKTNDLSNLNIQGIRNIDQLSSTLSPEEKKKLKSLKFNLTFTPTTAYGPIKFPELKYIRASLLVLNMSSTSPIPINLSADVFSKNESYKIRSKFKKYHEQYLKLLQQFESHNLDLARHIDKHLHRDIKAMKDLQVEASTVDNAFDYSIQSQTDWTMSESTNEWNKQVELKLKLQDAIPETLVPNFQTCLLSRVYSIQLNFKFKNGQKCEMVVPIRIRCFADI
ncbi:Ubiquitin ligase-binding protein [Wickerhamomyces ciferrii]|uniref:Ubiquitin ligase-binding protein n=1 Tax=Wickerhamomyces ciferrii (strain ATCC 14091 / BCRC 22168 / CBS 111 / JCM 3599 / NBRC 0793 / NRRL Y-1031 F-60-10) TaxID=1206466 RepID=K0KB65_WICCF|nr:Ubiquitin ligase-binding protein [Wickerhamomyces ciferrii]CCH42240.1 Ubiquitin ligase-binding protein [Wickerhamomyces ciferrii]